MKPIIIITDTQQEYWRREFKAQTLPKGENFFNQIQKLVTDGIMPVLQLDTSIEELKSLRLLPKGSIIGWCHADETYSVAFAWRLSKISSLTAIMRPYRVSPLKFANIVKSMTYNFNSTAEIRSLKEVLKLISWIFRGWRMLIRQYLIKLIYFRSGKKLINIPIGYTNIFAQSLVSKFPIMGSDDNSIIQYFLGHTFGIPHDAKISFVGQSGQIVRELSIRALERDGNGVVRRRSGYGASNVLTQHVKDLGADYLSTLIDSKAVLCPPGNISGESFRVFECVTLGRIPLVQNHVTSDPNYSSYFLSCNDNRESFSWKEYLEWAEKLSTQEYADIVQKNYSILLKEIGELNAILQSLLNF